MSTTLIQVTIALSVGQQSFPAGTTFSGISVVVTDPVTGAQPAVLLTGTETPTPWAFTASVNPGAGTVTASALDSTGAVLGTPVTQTFTEAGSPPPVSLTVPLGITVTPVAPTAS